MLRKMEAEVLFCHARDASAGVAALIDNDCAVEVLDRFDPCGTSAIWVKVLVITELDEDAFFDWVEAIVSPYGGDLLEAGTCSATSEWEIELLCQGPVWTWS